ncbi:MAG: phosphate acyltransferase PlsX [Chthoniobacterales bacterium]
MRVVLDAMGGDFAPKNAVAGAVMALREYPHLSKLYLTGDAKILEAELAANQCNDSRLEIVHTTQIVEMKEQAVEAVRRKKDSSISRAVDLVKKGDADAVVSAGHTGAAVASTTIKLRTLEGVDRPGIASYIPTETNVCVLIDAGANVDARPEHMLQYAIMGAVYSKHVLGYENPAIGLMSIGGEDVKGSEFTKDIFQLLKKSGLNFRGNIEGHDLFDKPVEVVLCDGFVGNVVLKTAEATAHAVFAWLKRELLRHPVRKLGAMLAKDAFLTIRNKTNYEMYGGSPLLGVNGVCIIAHGSSTPLAMKNAIRVALESIEQRINPLIVEAIRSYNEKNAADTLQRT